MASNANGKAKPQPDSPAGVNMDEDVKETQTGDKKGDKKGDNAGEDIPHGPAYMVNFMPEMHGDLGAMFRKYPKMLTVLKKLNFILLAGPGTMGMLVVESPNEKTVLTADVFEEAEPGLSECVSFCEMTPSDGAVEIRKKKLGFDNLPTPSLFG